MPGLYDRFITSLTGFSLFHYHTLNFIGDVHVIRIIAVYVKKKSNTVHFIIILVLYFLRVSYVKKKFFTQTCLFLNILKSLQY